MCLLTAFVRLTCNLLTYISTIKLLIIQGGIKYGLQHDNLEVGGIYSTEGQRPEESVNPVLTERSGATD